MVDTVLGKYSDIHLIIWLNLDQALTNKREKKILSCRHAKLLQSCSTLCDPMDYSLPGSSVHGVLQARILEWVAISFFRGSFWPRDWTWVSYVSCIGRWVLYHHQASLWPYTWPWPAAVTLDETLGALLARLQRKGLARWEVGRDTYFLRGYFAPDTFPMLLFV